MNAEVVELLKKDFDKKIKNNPHYSLRSYAKFLGISPASLSNILSGKSDVTPKILKIIGNKLNLSPVEFKDLEDKTKILKKSKSIKSMNQNEMMALQMEEFNFISDWYHYAILEIFTLDKYSEDPKWIADKLGMSDVKKIEDAIERLISLKQLRRNESGELEPTSRFTTVLDYQFSSVAMRERQKQILKLCSERIDDISIKERDHSGLTLTVDPALVPEIKEKIKTFRRTLGNYVAKNNNKRSKVYELQISFIPLTIN